MHGMSPATCVLPPPATVFNVLVSLHCIFVFVLFVTDDCLRCSTRTTNGEGTEGCAVTAVLLHSLGASAIVVVWLWCHAWHPPVEKGF